MGKKYYQADYILENITNKELTNEETYFRVLMAQTPYHYKLYPEMKKKKNNSEVVYRRGQFIILKTGEAFIVHNRQKNFKGGHTHTDNYAYAKKMIDLCITKKLPNKPKKRLIDSLKRLSNDCKYIKRLKELQEIKK